MNPQLRAALIGLGMPSNYTDEQAQQYIEDNNITVVNNQIQPSAPPAPPADGTPAPPVIPATAPPATPPADMAPVAQLQTVINENQAANTTRFDSIEAQIATLNLGITARDREDPNCGYRNYVEFFSDVIQAGMTGEQSERLTACQEMLRQNAVGSDEARIASNPDGGFLIPPGFMPGVMTTDPQALQADTGALTRNIPMDANTLYINARVDKNHSSSVSGGFRVYRRAETQSVETSKAKFEQIKFEANSLMGLTYATEEILQQSPVSFAALIQSGFEDERISKLNYERIWGTGVGEYMGIQKSPALINVAAEGGQAADSIVGLNLIKMRARIWGYNNAVWMCNQDCYVQLTQAHITGTKNDVFLFNPARGIDVPDTILGRPVIFDENMASVGDTGDIMLINWREYLEGQMGGSTFQESIHVRFVNNERAFRFVIYNAGAPWWRTALTPKKSAVTLSPFVSLATR